MTILKFETKKFFSNPKNPLLIFIAILLIIFLCYSEQSALKEERSKLLEADQFSMMYLQSDITSIDSNDPMLVKSFNQALDALKMKLRYVQKEEWQKSLEKENLFLEASKHISNTYSADYLHQYDSNKIETNNYYLTKNLKPENGLYGVSANYYIRKIATILFSVYGLLFFTLLFYDLFSSEKENNHLPFLKTQPVPYRRFIVTKIVFAFLLLIGISCLFFFVAFCTGFFLSGEIGLLTYPVFITKVNEKFVQLSFPNYIIQGIIPLVLLNYILLISLVFIQNCRMQSEKLLVLLLSLLGLFSTLTQAISSENYYFSLLNYINIHQEIEWLFTHQYLAKNQQILGIVSLFFITGSFLLFTKKENIIEV